MCSQHEENTTEQSSLVTNVLSPLMYLRYFPASGIILSILHFYLVSHLQCFITQHMNFCLNIMNSLYYIRDQNSIYFS